MNKKKKIITVLIAVIFLTVLFQFIEIGNITSSSMEPLLETGSRVIVNKLSYVVGEPQKGDVVAVKKDGQYMIKRIVAASGDYVESKDGTLLLNGYVLDEPYILENMETDLLQKVEVPEGSYYLLGDNRENSIDSRYWEESYVTKSDIVGRVVFSFDGFKSIARYSVAEK